MEYINSGNPRQRSIFQEVRANQIETAFIVVTVKSHCHGLQSKNRSTFRASVSRADCGHLPLTTALTRLICEDFRNSKLPQDTFPILCGMCMVIYSVYMIRVKTFISLGGKQRPKKKNLLLIAQVLYEERE